MKRVKEKKKNNSNQTVCQFSQTGRVMERQAKMMK